MGIFGSFFSGSGSLTELGRAGKSKAFAQLFVTSELLILSLPFPGSIDPATMSQEQLLDLIQKAAKEMSQQTAITPFTYVEDSARLFPVFTTQEAAKSFLGQYSKKINRIVPFQMSSLLGKVLRPQVQTGGQTVLNPGGSDEYRLSAADVAALAAS